MWGVIGVKIEGWGAGEYVEYQMVGMCVYFFEIKKFGFLLVKWGLGEIFDIINK